MVKPLSLTPHHIYDSAYVSQGIFGIAKNDGQHVKDGPASLYKIVTLSVKEESIRKFSYFWPSWTVQRACMTLSQINGNSSATHLVFLSLGLQGTFLKELASSHCPWLGEEFLFYRYINPQHTFPSPRLGTEWIELLFFWLFATVGDPLAS